MVGIRGMLAAAAAGVLVLAQAGAAQAAPPPWAHARQHFVRPGDQSLSFSGTVAGVDFASASILVATARGLVSVGVTPSTSIYRGSQFASFADIGRGARVEIDAADIGGRLVAQLIRIR